MQTIHRVVLVGFVAVTAAGCSGVAVHTPSISAQEEAAGELFAWEGELAPGQRVEIIGRNGRITAEPSTTGTVEVQGERRGHNADEIRIEATEHGDGVTIEAFYPERGWWHGFPFGRSANINFSVAVPPGVDLLARSRNGRVEADGLGGDVEVETRNGSVTLTGIAGDAQAVTRNGGITVIADGNVDVQNRNGRVHVEAGGYARARSRNGSIDATIREADWTGDATFETRNGSIRLLAGE